MPAAQPEKEKKNDKTVLFVIIIVILLGVIAFLLVRQNSQSGTITKQEQKIKGDSIDIRRLNAELAETKASLDSLTDTTAAVRKLVDEKNKIIASLMAQASAVAYQGKIDTKHYQDIIAERDRQIADLNDQIQKLVDDKKALQSSLDQVTKIKDDLTVQNQDLNNKNMTLSTKAGLFQPGNSLRLEAMKDSKKEKTTNKAKQTDHMSVTFTISGESQIEKGNKTFMVRILNPDGTLATSTTASGNFKNSDGQDMQYSCKGTTAYDQTSKTIVMPYHQTIPFQAGKYSLELYQDGFLIGTSSLELK